MDRSATIASTTETEKRALNYLVNEYLSTSGFKMTTITFSNEVFNFLFVENHQILKKKRMMNKI